MVEITSDPELKVALKQQDPGRQRAIAALFADQVSNLIQDDRLATALTTALDQQAGDQERQDAYRMARSIATENYTACGQNVDWKRQAEHFVAAACVNALAAEKSEFQDRAWKAAIHARMADNCRQLSGDDDGDSDLPARQYQAATAFLTR